MKYDIELDIAIGKHRHDKHWKTKTILWSEFLERIKETHYTHETHAEYMGMPKDKQDEIKDVGGYVFGHIQGGRRLKGKIMHRSALTLDIDFTKNNPFTVFKFIHSCAAAIYSTHKHNETLHRYRLVIPLSREVFPDEYEAIARRVAGDLDIEMFDLTTFEPSRLMYWPSTPKDAPYVFKYNDAPILDADKILARYHDWQDVSEWPVSERSTKRISRDMLKAGDPLTKPGLIGTFNRKYSISDAIKLFLTDYYEPTDKEDRYTYKLGSTASGLVVYDDLYAYSHHGTDPASQQLCNAFDLVRLHKFSLQDEDIKDDRPINKMPSYDAMKDFVAAIPEIKTQLFEDKRRDVIADFEEVPDTIPEDADNNTEWTEKMDADRKGNFLPTSNNVALILLNDPFFKDNLAYDDFAHIVIAKRNLPWRGVNYQSREIEDIDHDCIMNFIEKTYKFNVSNVMYYRGLSVMMTKTRFHPVREWLLSLKWDKVNRLDTVLIDYFGCADNVYIRAISRKFFVAGVSRIFLPGCKFDTMLTLVGEQGKGKSTFANKIGMDWFTESFNTVEGNRAFEQLQGVWVVEAAEMSALKKAEVEAVKHFISKQIDRFRVAYGRKIASFPRQCIFIGSTNKLKFMKDSTGGRRFWPALLGKALKDVHKDLTKEEVAQIWAEAVIMFNLGETVYLNKKIEGIAKELQREHTEQDDRAGQIEEFLERLLPENWENMDWSERRNFLDSDEIGTVERQFVCGPEIWCDLFGGNRRDMTTRNMDFIHESMRMLKNWKELPTKKRFKGHGVLKGYQRVPVEKKKLF